LNSIKTTKQSIPRIIFRSDPAPSEAFVNIQKRLSGRFFCHMRLYGLQPLRNSFQSIILIRLHSVFSSGRRLRHQLLFSLCGNTNKHQTGLLRCSPRRMYHELLFCPVRLYGLQPLRNSFQSIILIRLHSVFFFGSAAASPTAFSLCGFTDMPQTGLLTYSPQRLYHELLFLSHAALRTSTAPQLLSKYYPYPDCTLFFLRVGGCVTTAFSLCGFADMPQTDLLTYSPQRLYHKLLF